MAISMFRKHRVCLSYLLLKILTFLCVPARDILLQREKRLPSDVYDTVWTGFSKHHNSVVRISWQQNFRSTCIRWSLLSSDEVWTNQFIPMLRAKLTKTTEELVPIFWTSVQSLHDCEPSEDVYSIKEWREISPGTRYISSRSLIQKDPGIWELQLDTSSDDGQIISTSRHLSMSVLERKWTRR